MKTPPPELEAFFTRHVTAISDAVSQGSAGDWSDSALQGEVMRRVRAASRLLAGMYLTLKCTLSGEDFTTWATSFQLPQENVEEMVAMAADGKPSKTASPPMTPQNLDEIFSRHRVLCGQALAELVKNPEAQSEMVEVFDRSRVMAGVVFTLKVTQPPKRFDATVAKWDLRDHELGDLLSIASALWHPDALGRIGQQTAEIGDRAD